MDTLKTILDSKIIAIARGIYGEDLVKAALALYEGGVRAFEVTFEQDKPSSLTADAIRALSAALPADAAVGAGTVMNREQVIIAAESGAAFIISPNTDKEVIEETKRLSLISIPGAITPTEIAAAHRFGADIVKIFPAGALGVDYFKAVRAPLAHIMMAAVAGITKNNIRSFEDAGAAAYGVSSSLFDPKLIAEKRFDLIRSAAEDMYSALG
ncbi:MAG: bifunctional 4-hydroxy-2-oxoglutarate aldolase/2-dehydro-3-deoxy-phosphogluconate aldolase [Clostridia bacterium]|nr:bifunctional 4-hydroxy-2-oxoglutarate aldolase/2-dehydro-3-deoxy-phosphogluconate aldolase [Clostridia bacterium]